MQLIVTPAGKVNFKLEIEPNEIRIPLRIFSELSTLQAIVLFLKKNLGLTLKEIAKELNRNYHSIKNTYYQVKDCEFSLNKNKIISYEEEIPLSFFKKKNYLPPLEIVTLFLINKGLKNKEIAKLLSLNQKTISAIKYKLKKRGEIK